jgi:hypothetical protein
MNAAEDPLTTRDPDRFEKQFRSVYEAGSKSKRIAFGAFAFQRIIRPSPFMIAD